jgi:hypothetical protein
MYMQWLVEAINALGTLQNMQGLDQGRVDEILGPGTSLTEAAGKVLGDNFGDAERKYFESWPATLQESIRAALYKAASQGERIQVQWVPGYDYGVKIWDAAGSRESPGGLIMQFTSPYPQGAIR